MDHHEEERNQLAEDEEKLQLALQEVKNDDWYEYDDVDDEDEEEGDQLLIDLDAPSDVTAQSTSSGYVESGSRSHFMTIDEDSQDKRVAPPGLALPSLRDTAGTSNEQTLALNRALQGILENRIESIEAALEFNKDKQARLNDGAWADMENKKSGKGRTYGPFRSPFFHSREASTYPPDNEDTIMKRLSNELPYNTMKDHMNYNRFTKQILIQAIVEDTRERLMKPIMNRFEIEVKKSIELRNSYDEQVDDVDIERKKLKALRQTQSQLKERKYVDPSVLEENEREILECEQDIEKVKVESRIREKVKSEQDLKLEEIEEELKTIKDEDDYQILNRVDSSKVDWMKISKMWFRDGNSWLDCQKAWDFIANPKINLKPWKQEEEKKLLSAVEKYDAKEWESIAEDLGTGRTPFHCFYHYQNRFNPDLKSRPWKKEEDRKLLDAVKQVKETSALFSWGRVAAQVNSRSSIECKARYSYTGDEKKFGRWDRAEDARLIVAVNTMGANWRKISRFLGKRTPAQCRERYNNCLSPELNFFRFTYEEDRKLLRLLKNYGAQWKLLSRYFKGRTDSMLKTRYVTMERWRKETEWFNNLSDENKRLLLGKNLSVRERKLMDGQWESFYRLKLGVVQEDYKQQALDLKNGVDSDLIPPRPPIHFKYSRFQKCFAGKKNVMWSKKLALHQQLKETLTTKFQDERKKYEQEAAAAGRKKRRPAYSAYREGRELTEEESQLKEKIDSTVEETVGEQFVIPKHKLKEIMSALNLHFLGDSNIRVSQLLKRSRFDVVDKRKKAQEERKRINRRLRSILSRNKWIFMKKFGRFHHLLPLDSRPPAELKEDNLNYGNKVKGLLLRRLGGDPVTLLQSLQEKCANTKERREKWLNYKDNTKYKDSIAFTKRRISEILALRYLPKTSKEKYLTTLNKKLASVNKEYSKAYALKREMLDSVVEKAEVDIKFIQDAMQDAPISANSLEMNSDFLSIPDTLQSPLESLATKVSTQESVDRDDPSVTSTAKTARQANDIEGEKQTDLEENVVFSSLGCLPPSLTTLSALRSLLLHRQDLIKTAGTLYNPSHYKQKKKQHLHIIIDSDEDDAGSGEAVRDGRDNSVPTVKTIHVVNEDVEEDEECTGSWFKTDISYKESEKQTNVDESLKQHCNVPDADPKLIPNPRFPHKAQVSNVQDLEKYCEKVDKSMALHEISMKKMKSFLTNTGSSYQVMYGPTANNIEKVLELNSIIAPNNLDCFIKDDGSEKDKVKPPDCKTPVVSTAGTAVKSNVEERHNDSTIQQPNTWDEKYPLDCKLAVKEEMLHSLKNLKETEKALKNVVVVGLNFENNKIVHYNADELKRNESTIGKNYKSILKDLEKSFKVSSHKDESIDLEISETASTSTTESDETNSMQKELLDKNPNKNGEKESTSSENKTGTAQQHEKSVLNIDQANTAAKNKAVALNQPGSRNENSEFLVEGRSEKDNRSEADSNASQCVSDPCTSETIDRLFRNRKEKEDLKNLVVVGLDPNSGEVVHFKSDGGSGNFKAFKTKDSDHPAGGGKSEREASPTPELPSWLPENMSEKELLACMASVRQTEEYKRLLARFRALFMWPVLMSTLQPGEKVNLVNVVEPSDQVNGKKKVERRGRKRRLSVPESDSASASASTSAFASQTLKPTEVVPETDSASLPASTSAFKTKKPSRGKRKKKKSTRCFDTSQSFKRPRKDYSKLLPPSERPKRQRKPLFEFPVKMRRRPEVSIDKELPKWWKDAVLEAMMKKKEIEEGQLDNQEVSLTQDEDFMDKGNYSDDDWLTEVEEGDVNRENGREEMERENEDEQSQKKDD